MLCILRMIEAGHHGKNLDFKKGFSSHLQLFHSSLRSETRFLALDRVGMQSFPCHQRPDLVIDTQRFQLLFCCFSVSTSRKVYQDYCSWLSHACKHHRCCTRTSTDPALLDAGEHLNYHRCSSRGGNVNTRHTCFFKPVGRSPPNGNLLRCAKACRRSHRQSYYAVLSDVALLLHHIVDQSDWDSKATRESRVVIRPN